MNGFPHNTYEFELDNGVLPFLGKIQTRFSIVVDEGVEPMDTTNRGTGTVVARMANENDTTRDRKDRLK